MGEVKIVSQGKTRGYLYPVCKKSVITCSLIDRPGIILAVCRGRETTSTAEVALVCWKFILSFIKFRIGYLVMANLWILNQVKGSKSCTIDTLWALACHDKIVEICAIPFFGYLIVMTQLIDFQPFKGNNSCILEQLWQKCTMHQICYSNIHIVTFHRILWVCYLVTADFDKCKLIQGL